MSFNTEKKLLGMDNTNNECAWYKDDRVICSNKSLLDKILKHDSENISVVTTSDKEILKKLKKKMNCLDEICILKKSIENNILSRSEVVNNIKQNFKPVGPKNDIRKWLSNVNIDENLEQLERKYKESNFLHIYFKMRDFRKHEKSPLNTLDIKKEYLENGIRTIGVVFNTDYSTGRGIHWFACFIDMRKKPFTVEYFNSAGDSPLEEFGEWFLFMKNKIEKDLNTETKYVNVSNIDHQRDNSSCGVYSIYYIYLRLKGISYEYFKKNKIPDELMYSFRKSIFTDFD